MYGKSRVNAKVERRSTFTFTSGLSYIVSISFTPVNFTCVRTEKLSDECRKSTLREGKGVPEEHLTFALA